MEWYGRSEALDSRGFVELDKIHGQRQLLANTSWTGEVGPPEGRGFKNLVVLGAVYLSYCM